jgi:hypothetical protein
MGLEDYTPSVDDVETSLQPEVTESGPKPPVLSFQRNSDIQFERFEQTFAYDSIALYQKDGNLVTLESLEKLPPSVLLQTVLNISQMIESQQDIKAFSEGRLDIDAAVENSEAVLAMQFQDIRKVLGDLAFAQQFSKEDLTKMLDYVYETGKSKPFTEELSSVLFTTALACQRELLYSAMESRKMSLEEASGIIRKLPYGGTFLLDGEPTTNELSQFFTQTEDEAEINLVVDQQGRYFLVQGMNKDTGVITYRSFPDLVADFHTHRIDYPFSAGDIGTYKSLGDSRDIYSITSNKVKFFVCSPSGIFEFEGNLEENVFDEQDRKNDSLMIPCTVTNEDTGEEASFNVYTNHTRGESGRFIQEQMEKRPRRLRIELENGDTIHFTSWEELKRDDKLKLGISKLHE